jgi:hypothetical protein
MNAPGRSPYLPGAESVSCQTIITTTNVGIQCTFTKPSSGKTPRCKHGYKQPVMTITKSQGTEQIEVSCSRCFRLQKD